MPDNRNATESPFMPQEPVRLGFRTVVMLLMMVVAAGIGLLVYYALRVPAIASELNAWLGRPDAIIDRSEARQAQLIFALFVYTAPLGMGILVYLLHHLVNWLDRRTETASEGDDEFRME